MTKQEREHLSMRMSLEADIADLKAKGLDALTYGELRILADRLESLEKLDWPK